MVKIVEEPFAEQTLDEVRAILAVLTERIKPVVVLAPSIKRMEKYNPAIHENMNLEPHMVIDL